MFRYLTQVNKTVTKKEYPKKYFEVNQTIMRLSLIWFPERKSTVQRAFSYAFVFMVVVVTPIFELSFLRHTAYDANLFVNNLGISLSHTVGTLKVFNWCLRYKRILRLMDTLQSGEFEYETMNEFEPGHIAQLAKQKNIIFSTLFFWMCVTVLSTAYVEPMIFYVFSPDNLIVPNQHGEAVFCRHLPFLSSMPFDHTTYISCGVAIAIQFLLISYLTFTIIAVDTVFMAIINYITAHLDILQTAFRTIRARALIKLDRATDAEVMLDDRELCEEIAKEAKKSFKHLQTVYSLCETMEEIYTIQTLIQVFVSLVVMCTCMYLLSTEIMGSKLFFLELVYIGAIQFQLFLYCWFGNELTLAHAKVPLAIFQSDWLSTNKFFKQSMLITIIRTQRPLVLTVGKFSPLTLNTLVTILRGSYSLFAVLKNGDTQNL